MRLAVWCGVILVGCGSKTTPDAASDPVSQVEMRPASGPEIPAAALTADLALARQTLERLHPGYDRYTPRATLDASWERLEAAASAGMTLQAAVVELSRIVADIRCSHTKVEMPEALETARASRPTYLPFRFQWLAGGMWVERAVSGVALSRGDEVLAIDGIAVARWFDTIAPLLSIDGDNDHAKPAAFSASEEYLGSGLDHFGPLLAEPGADVVLEVQRADGSVDTVTAARLDTAGWQAFNGAARFDHDFSDEEAVRFEAVGDDIGVLTIDTFVNYRTPVEPEARLRPIFDRMRDEGRTSLILDLRANGGGSDGPPDWLLAELIDRPIQEFEETRRRDEPVPAEILEHIQTWDPSALQWDPERYEPAVPGQIRGKGGRPEPLQPRAGGFRGRVFALTSPTNTSGVTHLLSTLRRSGRVTLVGERTGGAPSGATAGVLVFLTLPNTGMRVRVPLYRVVMSGEVPERTGLDPDVVAPVTPASFVAGEDPAREAAIDAARASR